MIEAINYIELRNKALSRVKSTSRRAAKTSRGTMRGVQEQFEVSTSHANTPQMESGFAGTKQIEVMTSPEARRIYSRAGVRARKEIVTGSAFYALSQYARKRPLTFAGRFIGHTLGPISIAFWAYDVYSLYQYFRND